MSNYSELEEKLKESERLIDLQKVHIEALLSQNYELKREVKMHEENIKNIGEEGREYDEGWVYFGDMCVEEWLGWVKIEAKKRMDENSRYAFELADDIQRAQYRVDDFMEELAKAATRWASD